jgi:hypothetical protein
VKDWSVREDCVLGKDASLVNPTKVLPLLNLKLGLMKNFLKALDKSDEGFLYLRRKFPYLSNAEVKQGITVSPQV